MATPDLFSPIRPPPETLRALGGVLTERVRDLEAVHSRYFDNIRLWWKWYEAEPARKRKDTPWQGASNIIAPIIRTQTDARTAQDFSLIWGTKDKLYSGKSENEEFAANYLAPVMGFANWVMDAEVRPFWAILDWLHERNAIGGSVLSVSWEESERFLFAPGKKRPERVTLRRGARWTHWPAEKILWTPGISVREAEEVVTQRLLGISDLHQMQASDSGYFEDALEALRKTPHELGSPGAEVDAEKAIRAGIDPEQNALRRGTYDVRCLWLDWPILGGLGVTGLEDLATVENDDIEKTRVPLIVELAPDCQKILRILPNPYLMADGNPFFDLYYRRQVGYARGVGLAKILEGMQRASSTIVNQSIDSRTLQNSMSFKTTSAKLRSQPITPGSGILVDAMNEIERFDIPSGSPFDLALSNLMQVWAERAGTTSDPVLGRESRSGGHPSPATNYTGQLAQSAKMGSVPTFILDEQLAAAGLYTLSLYQQFDTDAGGRLTRVFGARDASKIKEWLFPTDMSLVGNLQLRLTALSDESPDQTMQRSLMISQVTQGYFANILKLVQVLSSQQVPPPVKQAAVQAIQVLGTTQQKFLEAAGYDEAQEAILRLTEGDANALGQLSALAARMGGGPGGSPEPAGGAGVAEPPGAPGGPPQAGPQLALAGG